jgi:hypothetical protein
MFRRLAVVAFLLLLLAWVLTYSLQPPTPPVVGSAARAQEVLVPAPPASQPAPDARDPATVASELLLENPRQAPTPLRMAPQWAGLGYVTEVGDALARLRRQVRQLKRDADTDLSGDRRRELTGEADEVLNALDAFDARLVVGRPRAAIADDYSALERRVRALTRNARTAGLSTPLARDPAGWVTMADERLGEAVYQGGGREVWEPALVARGADNFVFLARDLWRKGEYSLADGTSRVSLLNDLRALSDAAEFFRASVAGGSPPARLAQDFASAEQVWARIVPAMAELTHGERLALDPRASSVEDAVVGLHRRLGLAGTPAHVTAVTETATPVNGLGIPYGGTGNGWQPR